MPTRVLFVCLGNICRSPMAEALLVHRAREAGRSEEFEVDSAATGDWHIGLPPDPRTIEVLRLNGIEPIGRARKIGPSDIGAWDHIIVMERAILSELRALGFGSELSLASEWAEMPTEDVPDPYRGTIDDFQHSYALLDAVATGLLNRISR